MKGILELLTLTEYDVIMIVVCTFLFVVLTKLLEKNLFGPYLSLIAAREAATSGSADEAKDIESRAVAIEDSVQEQIREARLEALEAKVKHVSESAQKAAGIVAAAENEAKSNIEASREKVQAQLAELQKSSEQEIDVLAQSIAARVKNPTAALH